jgi:hypothetical protein
LVRIEGRGRLAFRQESGRKMREMGPENLVLSGSQGTPR